MSSKTTTTTTFLPLEARSLAEAMQITKEEVLAFPYLKEFREAIKEYNYGNWTAERFSFEISIIINKFCNEKELVIYREPLMRLCKMVQYGF